MRTLFRKIGLFRHDSSGNIAVIFTLALLPILSAVGCALDYSRATKLRSKLQSASDAASVGSVAKKSPGFIAAGAMTGGRVDPGRRDRREGHLRRQYVGDYRLHAQLRDARCGQGRHRDHLDGEFLGRYPDGISGIMGKSKMTVTGSSTSVARMPLFIDFYLLMDNSPSMGVGATPADVTKMVNNTSDQCAFACHDLNDSNNYYNKAKSLGVTTRIDVLRTATQQLMDTASVRRPIPASSGWRSTTSARRQPPPACGRCFRYRHP